MPNGIVDLDAERLSQKIARDRDIATSQALQKLFGFGTWTEAPNGTAYHCNIEALHFRQSLQKPILDGLNGIIQKVHKHAKLTLAPDGKTLSFHWPTPHVLNALSGKQADIRKIVSPLFTSLAVLQQQSVGSASVLGG